jgi:hypothetical protein
MATTQVPESYVIPLRKEIDAITTPATQYTFEAVVSRRLLYTPDHKVKVLRVTLPPVGRHFTSDVAEPIIVVRTPTTSVEKEFLTRNAGLMKKIDQLTTPFAYGGNAFASRTLSENVKSSNDVTLDEETFSYFKMLKAYGDEKPIRYVEDNKDYIFTLAHLQKGNYFSVQELVDVLNERLSRAGLMHIQLECKDRMLRVKDQTINVGRKESVHRGVWEVFYNPAHSVTVSEEVLPLLGIQQTGVGSANDPPYYIHVNNAKVYRKNPSDSQVEVDLYFKGLRELVLTAEILPETGDGSGTLLSEPLAVVPLQANCEAKPIQYEATHALKQHTPLPAGTQVGELKRVRFTLATVDKTTKFVLAKGTIQLVLEISREAVKEVLGDGEDEYSDMWMNR